MFCVYYTCVDLYHKRKKYIWAFKLVQGGVSYIVFAFCEPDTLPCFLHPFLGIKIPKRQTARYPKTQATKRLKPVHKN